MAFADITVVEVRCDGCGQLAVDDDDARWFTDRDAARTILASHGWVFANGGIKCDGCVQRAACELVGHTWPGGWIHRAYEWYIGRTRTCLACGHIEGDPPLPAPAHGGAA